MKNQSATREAKPVLIFPCELIVSVKSQCGASYNKPEGFRQGDIRELVLFTEVRTYIKGTVFAESAEKVDL
ncbi:hypothetical protein [Salipaludibacillus aurantiacus]|uniref:Uncharacterized protein n=1 Tax=Salipaludibacillus aurantiacus TaxID=1601833 RepID=A0A1H9X753_9BACI|nr:hypothetical protein [Salipaludibacillus aurantiacus]SES42016.1 hypothetical protein SAMN05518684_1282 [Salipaludibacillus aurantiacus]